MASVYKQFLSAPNSSLLAEKATLHYVTTTTTFTGATDIIKHLNTLQKQVKKKQQDIINTVQDQSSAVLEVDNVFEFVTSGGVYLPGLDDNFVADRTVYFLIIHIVNFDADGKISQIRQSWDQGALLKQIEVIGKSGRNWPIRDSREQLTMIKAALKASGATAPTAPSANETTARARGNSSNAMRDPHASLQLFGSREEMQAPQASSVASPYGGNRPVQRDFTDILGDNPDGSHHQATMSPNKAGQNRQQQRGFTDILGDEPSDAHYSGANHQRSASPAKIGAGKHYQPMRLFDGPEEVREEEETPKVKPAPPLPKQPVPENRQKAVNMMNANWSSYDESPKTENQRINVAGDGMGSRKGADANAPRKGYNRDNLAENKIAIAGDGMGGKKGTDRSWLYGGGDENEDPLPISRKAPGMRGGNAQSSLWDM